MTDLKTRTYQGSTIDEVLPQIRDELGDDAIVLRQREGLKGGVGGFFQKRCVEVEARRGAPAGASAPATSGFDVADRSEASPPPAIPTSSLAETMLAQAGSAGFGAQLADAQQEQATLAPEPAPAATVAAALTVDDILGSAAAAAPPARTRVVTSPQVDALPPNPVPEAAAPAPAPAPVRGPAPAAAPIGAPAPVAVGPSPASDEQRAARAERAIEVLADRGLSRPFSARLVDDVMSLRVPLQPSARLSSLVSRELAQRIPVLGLARPGVSAWIGTGGSGKTSTVAALARAHAADGGLKVACVSLRTPDGGATLRAALEGSGVDVHVAAEDEVAIPLVQWLTAAGMTVLIDTAPVSPRNEAEVKALGRRLQKLGVEDVHLCIPATVGFQVARDVLNATSSLKPTAVTITHADETERVGAAVQLAIDAALPISYVNEGAPTGRGLRAADPVDLAKALIG